MLTLLPVAFLVTLRDVQSIFPGAMIAGGALRDLDNDRAVKDVDIFAPNCPHDFDQCLDMVEKLLKATNGRLLGVMGGYENWATEECVGVFDIETNGFPYQLICLSTDQASILNRIDFGLCRIASDGTGITRTEEYLADQAAQCFTLLRSDDIHQRDRSIKRHQRFQEKYPGWPIRTPTRPASDFSFI